MKFKDFVESSKSDSKQIGSKGIYAVVEPNNKNDDKIEKLLKDYDWYTFAIDDYTQLKAAERDNQYILDKLKDLGCEKIVNTGFESMAGKRVKEIKC